MRESPFLQSCLLWMMLQARTAKPVKFVLSVFRVVRSTRDVSCEDDYFDPASGAWDVDGLKDDLRLAKAP